MARIIIETDDGHKIADIVVSNKNGPWTDGGDIFDAIVWEVTEALRLEGDEA